MFVHLSVPPLGNPARPEAQPTRHEAQPARPETQPVRSEAQPARSGAQPARLQVWLAEQGHIHNSISRLGWAGAVMLTGLKTPKK